MKHSPSISFLQQHIFDIASHLRANANLWMQSKPFWTLLAHPCIFISYDTHIYICRKDLMLKLIIIGPGQRSWPCTMEIPLLKSALMCLAKVFLVGTQNWQQGAPNSDSLWRPSCWAEPRCVLFKSPWLATQLTTECARLRLQAVASKALFESHASHTAMMGDRTWHKQENNTIRVRLDKF